MKNYQELIAQLTLEEKASLCSGRTFWDTRPVERMNIPSIMMSDGPHGLRKQVGRGSGDVQTLPATCFPPACGMASSWNTELVAKVGRAIGTEARAENISIVLGPGVNIKRSPLCGRNFEYYSEDPVLSAEMGAAWVQGVQSMGVGASLKHFAANNQETERMSVDTRVDERTLHEIYLFAFERIVKQARPWTVMCAYNKLNGELCSENKWLLTDILRTLWHYDGYVISDWGAVDHRDLALKAGLDLQMPTNGGASDKDIVAAVKAGTLDEQLLDKTIERHWELLSKALEDHKLQAVLDHKAHHRLAKEAASESIVLLKNENAILPLDTDKQQKIAVIGEFVKKPRIQGGGSSHVVPVEVDIPFDKLAESAGPGITLHYAPGYNLEEDQESDKTDQQLVDEAVALAGTVDVAMLFVGLPERYESEGYDRTHMELPPEQTRLIQAVCAVQSHVVVILTQGSAVTMDSWYQQVDGILLTWLLGQAGGGAISDVVWGKVNPSGKLAETLPIKLSDTPAYLNFPGDQGTVACNEGIFVGYRYYDTREMEVLYPFGHGLSYTTFEYADMQVSADKVLDSETVKVSLTVRNTGKCSGKEIVQLYIRDIRPPVRRPEKELKAFAKVELAPGEAQRVSFSLSYRDFAYYNVTCHDWRVGSGEYEILIGRSSRDIPLCAGIHVESTQKTPYVFDRHSTVDHVVRFAKNPEIGKSLIEQFREALFETPPDNFTQEMIESMIRYFPLRALYHMSKGGHTLEMTEQLIQQLNAG